MLLSFPRRAPAACWPEGPGGEHRCSAGRGNRWARPSGRWVACRLCSSWRTRRSGTSTRSSPSSRSRCSAAPRARAPCAARVEANGGAGTAPKQTDRAQGEAGHQPGHLHPVAAGARGEAGHQPGHLLAGTGAAPEQTAGACEGLARGARRGGAEQLEAGAVKGHRIVPAPRHRGAPCGGATQRQRASSRTWPIPLPGVRAGHRLARREQGT